MRVCLFYWSISIYPVFKALERQRISANAEFIFLFMCSFLKQIQFVWTAERDRCKQKSILIEFHLYVNACQLIYTPFYFSAWPLGHVKNWGKYFGENEISFRGTNTIAHMLWSKTINICDNYIVSLHRLKMKRWSIQGNCGHQSIIKIKWFVYVGFKMPCLGAFSLPIFYSNHGLLDATVTYTSQTIMFIRHAYDHIFNSSMEKCDISWIHTCHAAMCACKL